MKAGPDLTIVIPCLNEEKTIQRAILEAKKYGRKEFGSKFEIIISDNGSTDKSLSILKKINSIRIVHVPLRGYGAALHWGILNSKSKYVLFADADLSYPFSNVSAFKKLVSLKPDLVLGSRFKGTIEKNSMPFLHRYIGTPFLTFLIKNIYKLPISDCNSGMRLVKKSFYQSLKMRNSGMEWASELLIRTALKNGKYMETPISFKKDQRKTRPHLSTWSDGWRHLKSILLLKPSSLYFPLGFFFFLALLFFYYSTEILGLFFMSISVTLFFSILAAHFLDDYLSKRETVLYRFLREFKLIPVVSIATLLGIVMILILPADSFIFKVFIITTISIAFIWVFLIETIKTHLVKKLPD